MILLLFIIFTLLYITISIILSLYEARKMKSKQYKDFLEVFQNEHIKLPTLKFGTSYSWATFEIVFSSKEDYEISKQKGLQDLFKTRIKRYYNPEFNPDLSVYYKYIGQIPIWMTLMNEDRMKDEQAG